MKRWLVLFLLLISLLLTGFGLTALNSINVTWWTVDGGGTTPELSGGAYTLRGTTGQADAGIHNAGRFSLYGGFWNPAISSPENFIYLPVIYKP